MDQQNCRIPVIFTQICYNSNNVFQIRRSVRKKHTLPNYKIRYRPFFIKPEQRVAPQDIYIHGSKLSAGHLEVTVIECTRLVKVSHDSLIYCTLAIGEFHFYNSSYVGWNHRVNDHTLALNHRCKIL